MRRSAPARRPLLRDLRPSGRHRGEPRGVELSNLAGTGCPRCGAALLQGQEYCLECGLRVPGSGPARSRIDSARGWPLRALAALVVATAGAAVAIASSEGDAGSAKLITATGGFASSPETTTLASPISGGAAGIVDWPPGDEGWTIALASLPQTGGRTAAVAKARAARRKQLPTVGILDSSRYASLHPGYWIVFTGIYTSEAEATSELQRARRVARTATVRRVVP